MLQGGRLPHGYDVGGVDEPGPGRTRVALYRRVQREAIRQSLKLTDHFSCQEGGRSLREDEDYGGAVRALDCTPGRAVICIEHDESGAQAMRSGERRRKPGCHIERVLNRRRAAQYEGESGGLAHSEEQLSRVALIKARVREGHSFLRHHISPP